MNRDRYIELQLADARLTEEEMSQGWHFCPDWDGLLVGPKTPEIVGCCCGVFDTKKLTDAAKRLKSEGY